ncbi:PAS domain-containing sensor histidine kinase [Deltaproteobacteria bacterium IMCC39524]|nr:PAS domain-containing sensor histidine kinase [Deltaproteobacteria bacterium IMCC39524]
MTFVAPSLRPDFVNDVPLASHEELEHQASFFDGAFLTRHLLDVMPGMVLVLNNYRQIIFTNRAFYHLSGRPETESLVGLLVGDVLQCHVALDKDAVCGTTDSCETCGALVAMLSGLSGVDSVQECTLTQRDGIVAQHLTLRVWSAPLCFGGEEFVVLAGTDVSHERRRLALERTFFHDILNLVASIQGFAELMEIDESVDPMMVSRRIQSASQKVIEEIDAQRVLLAVEKGELKVDNHVLTSLDVLKDVIELYEGQEISRKRILKVGDNVTRASFVSDATLLRRILGNMVKNALEASPEGYTVTLGVDKSAAGFNFWVHNATVISASYHQRIFQRDFSTKGSGRGLGTYSMKLLGRFLSGDVSFESSPESGTRFTLSLPDVCPETC